MICELHRAQLLIITTIHSNLCTWSTRSKFLVCFKCTRCHEAVKVITVRARCNKIICVYIIYAYILYIHIYIYIYIVESGDIYDNQNWAKVSFWLEIGSLASVWFEPITSTLPYQSFRVKEKKQNVLTI